MPRYIHSSISRAAAVLLLMSTSSFAQTPPILRSRREKPPHRAVERDDAGEVARLVRSGADVRAVNRYGAAPISLACARGNTEIIEQLLRPAQTSTRRFRKAKPA